MPEKSYESSEYRSFKPRNVGIIAALIILFIILWSTFVIIPAGSRGVVLWWGSVEKRIMGEGLNFKVPVTETVIIRSRRSMHPRKNIRL
jgi:regulator of protease activity HflC (stomatin/prohibitin superfamily)